MPPGVRNGGDVRKRNFIDFWLKSIFPKSNFETLDDNPIKFRIDNPSCLRYLELYQTRTILLPLIALNLDPRCIIPVIKNCLFQIADGRPTDEEVNYKEAYELLYWLEDHSEIAAQHQNIYLKIKEVLADDYLDNVEAVEMKHLLGSFLKTV